MTPTRRLTLACLAAVAASASLTACAPLVLGGTALGAMMVADRRTSAAQLEDETIELRAASRVADALKGSGHVNITSYNRQVLLTGEVPDEAARKRVEQVVGQVENVRLVVNELAVMPVSSLTQRSSDVLVTGRVKAALVDAKDLQANAFKVVTERGTVYLMGRVTEREARRVTQVIASASISGLQRIVRAFELISEEDLARLQPPAAPAGTRPAQ